MRALIVALVVACGPGFPDRDNPPFRNPRIDDFAANLTHASQQHDIKGVRALLRDSVTIGGLWFPDVACFKQFAFAGEVKGPRLDELARCLTTIELASSTRADALPDVIVMTYAPGLEIEARFIDDADGPWLAWIGYAARRDLQDALPTISPTTLESLRAAGDRDAPLAGPGAFDEVEATKSAYAWMKVCIDREGVITGAHVREASSPRAARTFVAAVETWRFRPFMLGNQPTPVCSMVKMQYPAPTSRDNEKLPLPIPAGSDDMLNVPSLRLGDRIAGNTTVAPDDMDKTRVKRARLHRLIAALHYCIDTQGRVSRVVLIRSSGLRSYDTKLIKTVESWAYKPFLDEGKPIPVCSSVNFIYSQR